MTKNVYFKNNFTGIKTNNDFENSQSNIQDMTTLSSGAMIKRSGSHRSFNEKKIYYNNNYNGKLNDEYSQANNQISHKGNIGIGVYILNRN